METQSPRGRPRDDAIDRALLAAARRQLAEHGFAGMSLGAVAREAGTTRQALYRRWPTKQALAESTVASIATTDRPPATGTDPYADLVAELEDFRHGVSRPGRLSLVGAMLQNTNDPGVRERYRERVVAPRRRRLRTILQRALDADAEPAGWAERVATLTWRALGGTPPPRKPEAAAARRLL